MKFRPLHDRVLVLPDGAPPKTGGLAAPPSQKEEPTTGVVVATGPESLRFTITDENRAKGRSEIYEVNASGVAIGERVQWAKYAGREVEHDGQKHKLLRLEEIDGVLVDE